MINDNNNITDRQLLEYAAKAMGYRIKVWKLSGPVCWINNEPWIWNPLSYHEDAERVVSTLLFDVVKDPDKKGWAVIKKINGKEQCLAINKDRYRAIVIAAANIGMEK